MTELGTRYRMQEYKKQLQRIAELEAQVIQLSHDRDRLCEIVLRNPARKALAEIVETYEQQFGGGGVLLTSDLFVIARKALADTEHEVNG